MKNRIRVRTIIGLTALVTLSLTMMMGAKPNLPLHEESYQQIIAKYFLIADFSVKPETRPMKDEVFWRYPMVPAPVTFPLVHDIENKKGMDQIYPRTDGDGRAIEHLNFGRTLLLDGKWEDAKNTFLSARARFGKTFEYHRRNDYFIANAFINSAMDQVLKQNKNWDDIAVKPTLNNAATFLSWAFKIKQDIPDPIVDQETPRGLYNLAAIYFRYGRYAGAFGAATDGLNYLRKSGRQDYRPQLRRILAESHIQNRDYLQAAQELDLTLRLDPNPQQAGQIFARLADLYFDLNNFELAEDLYALANRVDNQVDAINPNQFVLRGESLFWLGQYSEAQKMFQFALNTIGNRQISAPLTSQLSAVASIRMADAWLARKDYEKAKTAYFSHIHNYLKDPTADYARIRLACMELPFYDGKNIEHARNLLESLKGKVDQLNPEAVEMAWACQVGSWTQHERTDEMLDRVRELVKRYPESRFLKSMVTPIRETQAAKIDAYFKNSDNYGAVDFFEKNRKNLFPKISPSLKNQLFAAYTDIAKPEKAAEFWPTDKKLPDDLTLLRQVVNASDLAHKNKHSKWTKINRELGKKLLNHSWSIKFDDSVQLYLNRILFAEDSEPHYRWIYNLYNSWSRTDLPTICTLALPLIKRLTSKPAASNMSREEAKKLGQHYIDTYLADAMQYDPYCGYSLMEFEISLNADSPAEVASRYKSRTYLKINETTAKMYWELAEQLYSKGNRTAATDIWQLLVENGNPGLPETRYAKSRLEKVETVYDGLWNK